MYRLIAFILCALTLVHCDQPQRRLLNLQHRRRIWNQYGNYGHLYRNQRGKFDKQTLPRKTVYKRSRFRDTPYQPQLEVGDTEIKFDNLEPHFPFDKKDGSKWDDILKKSSEEADKLAAADKMKDDAEMKADDAKQAVEKKKEDAEEAKKEKSEEAKKEKEKAEEAKKGEEGKESKDKDSAEEGGKNPSEGKKSGEKGKNDLAEEQRDKSAYVPDDYRGKTSRPCIFSPANCYCGSRPTQRSDLLCAAKKREYCGWFCKHKMGGRGDKSDTEPAKAKGGEEHPTLAECTAKFGDPGGSGMGNDALPIKNNLTPDASDCVCHIDRETGKVVVQDVSHAPDQANQQQGPNSGAEAPGAGPPPAGGPNAPPPAGGPNAPPPAGGAPPPAGGDAAAPVSVAEAMPAGTMAGDVAQAGADINNAATNAAATADAALKEGTDAAQQTKSMASNIMDNVKGLGQGAMNGLKNAKQAIFGNAAASEVQTANDAPQAQVKPEWNEVRQNVDVNEDLVEQEEKYGRDWVAVH